MSLRHSPFIFAFYILRCGISYFYNSRSSMHLFIRHLSFFFPFGLFCLFFFFIFYFFLVDLTEYSTTLLFVLPHLLEAFAISTYIKCNTHECTLAIDIKIYLYKSSLYVENLWSLYDVKLFSHHMTLHYDMRTIAKIRS